MLIHNDHKEHDFPNEPYCTYLYNYILKKKLVMTFILTEINNYWSGSQSHCQPSVTLHNCATTFLTTKDYISFFLTKKCSSDCLWTANLKAIKTSMSNQITVWIILLRQKMYQMRIYHEFLFDDTDQFIRHLWENMSTNSIKKSI